MEYEANEPKHIKVRGAKVHKPEKYRCGCSPTQNRGDRRGIRFGEIFAGAGCPLCRGLQTLSGIPVHVYEKTHDRCGESTGR